jgi:prephenate dehydrogenase
MAALTRVTVIGAGLIGTSVALALRERGVEVRLVDRNADAVRDAVRLGAGVPLDSRSESADLVVIAVPPAWVADVLFEAQRRELGRIYTDVASVKAPVIAAAAARGCDLDVFVPSHPMAGGERHGATNARGDLFAGRAWALCPVPTTPSDALDLMRHAAGLTGAVTYEIDAEEHDRAAALVSHVPHVVSSLLAAHLADADPAALRLAGRGLRDVTRIAAGDAWLWTDILTHNAEPVAELLDSMAADLRLVAADLRAVTTAESHPTAQVTSLLVKGNAGRERLAPSTPKAHQVTGSDSTP